MSESEIPIENVRKAEPILTDPNQLLTTIVKPWLDQNDLPVNLSLSTENALTADLIRRFKLPSLEKYPIDLIKQFPPDANKWALAAHMVPLHRPDAIQGVETLGGILGIGGGDDTFWDAKNLQKLLVESLDKKDPNYKFYVFLAPYLATFKQEPHIPFSMFNKLAKPSDLPEYYVRQASRDLGLDDDDKEGVFKETKILPFDWLIGKVDIKA